MYIDEKYLRYVKKKKNYKKLTLLYLLYMYTYN